MAEAPLPTAPLQQQTPAERWDLPGWQGVAAEASATIDEAALVQQLVRLG